MSEISRVGVVGAGTMGHGIAQVAAQSGFGVVLVDVSEPALKNAQAKMSKSLQKLYDKQKIQETPETILSRLEIQADLTALKTCDLVIEAATENREIKFPLFRQIDELLAETALLASNTSSISITELAAQTKRPDKVVGMHFMNPVPVMTLVEGIKGLATSQETFEKVKVCAERMGKTFVESKDAPGFIVNRILMPMINESFFALQEGLGDAESIDEAMKLGCHFPMGPLQLADFIGLDVCLFIMEVLHQDLGDSKYRPAPLLRKYVEAGWLGKKSARGVYSY